MTSHNGLESCRFIGTEIALYKDVLRKDMILKTDDKSRNSKEMCKGS